MFHVETKIYNTAFNTEISFNTFMTILITLSSNLLLDKLPQKIIQAIKKSKAF